jgi:TolB protein
MLDRSSIASGEWNGPGRAVSYGRACGGLRQSCSSRAIHILAGTLVVLGAACSPTTQGEGSGTTQPLSTSGATAEPVPTSRPESLGSTVDPGMLNGLIAFAHDGGIWISEANGDDRVQVTSDGGFDPSWSPDGTQIVYRRLLANDDGAIWVVNADGSDPRSLIDDESQSEWGPAWSPIGGEIAYNSDASIGQAIWLMNSDGSNRKLIGRGHGEYPTWSPDGSQLAFAGGNYYDIHVMTSDGSSTIALTQQPAYDMGPAWSPDGQWIAYHTQVDSYPNVSEPGLGPEMEIHLIRPDGSEDHAITSDENDDSFPTWSPDGKHLVWQRDGQLVAARPDGTGMVTLGPGTFPSWTK